MANEGFDEKIIFTFCIRVNKGAGLLHLDERVLWWCFTQVKVYIKKKRWGMGVDNLKLAAEGNNVKDFIHKAFVSQKLNDYHIECGNTSVVRDVTRVSHFILLF